MFEEIDGHGRAKQTLQRAIANGRIAHAYLFSGPEGVGKKLTAISFAKQLICPEKTGGACGCSVCSRIDGRIHPDVLLFEYKDRQTIAVDNVRDEIEREIFLRPFESKYKIFIVDGSERMNTSAQNAFLKTLEEPPRYCVIIITTHAPSMMLQTIRSRCRTVVFGKLDGRLAREKLVERGEFSGPEIDLALKIVDGSPGKALKITPEEAGGILETIKTLAEINSGSPSEVFEFVENILGKAKGNKEQRVKAEKFAEITALWIRDLIYATAGSGEPAYRSLRETSLNFARKREAASIIEKAAAVENTVAGIRLGNLNCRLALENLVLKIAEV